MLGVADELRVDGQDWESTRPEEHDQSTAVICRDEVTLIEQTPPPLLTSSPLRGQNYSAALEALRRDLVSPDWMFLQAFSTLSFSSSWQGGSGKSSCHSLRLLAGQRQGPTKDCGVGVRSLRSSPMPVKSLFANRPPAICPRALRRFRIITSSLVKIHLGLMSHWEQHSIANSRDWTDSKTQRTRYLRPRRFPADAAFAIEEARYACVTVAQTISMAARPL